MCPDSQSARSRIRFQVWGLALASALCACAPKDPPAPLVHFADAGDAAGIDFVHYNGFSGSYYYVETFGAGAAFLDYDGDDRLDLYLVNGTYLTGHPPDSPPVNRLYRNAGAGTFADVTTHQRQRRPRLRLWHRGRGLRCRLGDPDLFVANYGPNALYRNDQGTFAKTSAGLADPRWGSSAGFLDYDLDGDLDLFVANYVRYALDDESVCQQGQVRSYCGAERVRPHRRPPLPQRRQHLRRRHRGDRHRTQGEGGWASHWPTTTATATPTSTWPTTAP